MTEKSFAPKCLQIVEPVNEPHLSRALIHCRVNFVNVSPTKSTLSTLLFVDISEVFGPEDALKFAMLIKQRVKRSQ